MNNNKNNLEEAKKLNQQAAAKASEGKKYQMEAGTDYDLTEAKKLNEKSKNAPSSHSNSSASSSSR